MGKDKLEFIGKTLIQHGKASDRVYLMKLNNKDMPGIVDKLVAIAKENGYSKIFAKIPENSAGIFLRSSFVKEAEIPKFFSGKETCLFLSKFLSKERAKDARESGIEDILTVTYKKSKKNIKPKLCASYAFQKAAPEHAEQLSALYKRVFATYPFPVHDPKYILQTMKEHINYYIISDKERIVAASSAEIDYSEANAEMTDFATLPRHRGNNLSGCLLLRMEEEMKKENIKTAYTIARAFSAAMNITFARNNYFFAGTLINNTSISGQIESMNVWYKALSN